MTSRSLLQTPSLIKAGWLANKLTLLSLFVALVLGSATALAAPTCEDPFRPAAVVSDFDQELSKITDAEIERFLDHVKFFDQEAARDGVKVSTSTAQRFFHAFKNGNLKLFRNDSLRNNLRRHGFKIKSVENARQEFEALSAANKKRFLRKYVSTPEMKEAEEIVRSMRLAFTHNSLAHPERINNPHVPILASRFIETLTGFGGLNTQYSFNKKTMQSDDNVFFLAQMISKDETAEIPSHAYGSHGLTIDPAYAQEVGWISSFVMYPGEIYKARPNSWLPGFALRRQLYKTDFTVNDFDELLKTNLLASLADLQRVNPTRFKHELGDLQDVDSIQQMLTRHVFAPLGIGSRFELKVPVLVPRSKLTAF